MFFIRHVHVPCRLIQLEQPYEHSHCHKSITHYIIRNCRANTRKANEQGDTIRPIIPCPRETQTTEAPPSCDDERKPCSSA